MAFGKASTTSATEFVSHHANPAVSGAASISNVRKSSSNRDECSQTGSKHIGPRNRTNLGSTHTSSEAWTWKSHTRGLLKKNEAAWRFFQVRRHPTEKLSAGG